MYILVADPVVDGNFFIKNDDGSGHSTKSWPQGMAEDIRKGMTVGYSDGKRDTLHRGNIEADEFMHEAVFALKAGHVADVIASMEFAVGHEIVPVEVHKPEEPKSNQE